jgi:hypothetical protein
MDKRPTLATNASSAHGDLLSTNCRAAQVDGRLLAYWREWAEPRCVGAPISDNVRVGRRGAPRRTRSVRIRRAISAGQRLQDRPHFTRRRGGASRRIEAGASGPAATYVRTQAGEAAGGPDRGIGPSRKGVCSEPNTRGRSYQSCALTAPYNGDESDYRIMDVKNRKSRRR